MLTHNLILKKLFIHPPFTDRSPYDDTQFDKTQINKI